MHVYISHPIIFKSFGSWPKANVLLSLTESSWNSRWQIWDVVQYNWNFILLCLPESFNYGKAIILCNLKTHSVSSPRSKPCKFFLLAWKYEFKTRRLTMCSNIHVNCFFFLIGIWKNVSEGQPSTFPRGEIKVFSFHRAWRMLQTAQCFAVNLIRVTHYCG